MESKELDSPMESNEINPEDDMNTDSKKNEINELMPLEKDFKEVELDQKSRIIRQAKEITEAFTSNLKRDDGTKESLKKIKLSKEDALQQASSRIGKLRAKGIKKSEPFGENSQATNDNIERNILQSDQMKNIPPEFVGTGLSNMV